MKRTTQMNASQRAARIREARRRVSYQQTCMECGHRGWVSMTCTAWACQCCTRIQLARRAATVRRAYFCAEGCPRAYWDENRQGWICDQRDHAEAARSAAIESR